jgi:hypothetical protein
LATRINREHEQVEAAHEQALGHCRRCGELLIQAKKLLTHGQWLPWIRANLKIKKSRVEQYMQLAEAKAQRAGNLTWQDWQRISGHKPGHVTMYEGEQEWFTPPKYLDAARRVLGNIALDPASCVGAQKIWGGPGGVFISRGASSTIL